MDAVGHALSLTGSMAWSILWALVFWNYTTWLDRVRQRHLLTRRSE